MENQRVALTEEKNHLLSEYGEDVAKSEGVVKPEINFAEIEEKFKRYSHVEDVLHNGLIGSFVDGKYEIPDELKDDLKKLNKVLASSDGKTLVCHAKYRDFQFNFEVDIERLEIFSTAKLYLLEEKEEEEGAKKFKTLISSEVAPKDINIEKRAMEVWHISLEEEENETKLSELDSIIIRLSKDRTFGKDLIEILSQLYIFQMLKFLEGVGEAGKEVVKEYNEFVRLIIIKKPSIVNNHVKLKEVLDKMLSENELMVEIKKSHESEIGEIYREFYEPLEKISAKKEKSAEVESAPKTMEGAEIMDKEVKKKSAGRSKGEKPYYPNPAKPGKVDTLSKVNVSGGAGVAKIKPTAVKTPTPPKVETSKPQEPKEVVNKDTKSTVPTNTLEEEVSKGLEDEFNIKIEERVLENMEGDFNVGAEVMTSKDLEGGFDNLVYKRVPENPTDENSAKKVDIDNQLNL